MPLTGLVLALSIWVVSAGEAGGVSAGLTVVLVSAGCFSVSAPLPQAVAVVAKRIIPEIMCRIDLRMFAIL